MGLTGRNFSSGLQYYLGKFADLWIISANDKDIV